MEITTTVTNRAYQGLVEAANKNSLTVEFLASDVVERSGISYADLFKIGVITSAAFIKRFKSEELVNILSTAETNPEFNYLITKLTEQPYVNLMSDEAINGVNLLNQANLLVGENRVEEILNFQTTHPVAEHVEISEPVEEIENSDLV